LGVFSSFQNIFKIAELKSRVLFTFGLLAVYRVGAHIPTPGINGEELSKFLTERGGALMGFFDMFSGGALSRVTVFALGIMPYISASIIFQLLTVVIPAIGKLAKEGEAGRKKITKYTRYATIAISMIQSFGIAVGLESMAEGAFIATPGWSFRLLTMLTLTSGTAFIMWLGEQITERGIGNGISLIIFAGIVARFPAAIITTVNLMRAGELSIFFVIALVVLMIGVIVFIIYIERGQRKVPVQYAKRVVGRKVYGGQSTHHTLGAKPLSANGAGHDHVHDNVHRHDIFLRIFLHCGSIQPGGRCGQPEKIRRIYPGDKTRAKDVRIHIQGADEAYIRGCHLPGACLYPA
jgi:preprotein translocase subunit SecY